MTNLRKLARGEECLIRVPGHCSGDPATTVLCHLRLIGITGFGLKSADALGAHGCYTCHAVVDGQMKSEFTHDQRRLMFMEGMCRTLDKLIQRGHIKW
jgi:hypothetical protein